MPKLYLGELELTPQAIINEISGEVVTVVEEVSSVSGEVDTHVTDTETHLSQSDRETINSITGYVGTMAYENVSDYYSKSDINDTFGSGFTESSVTEVIEANEMVISAALNDLNENKANRTHTHTSSDITGIGTMAYENTSSYSSATEIATALVSKVDTNDIADFFDDAKYELSGQTHVINFYNGNTVKATIDATDFIKDGFLSRVTVEDREISGETKPCLVFEWNTDAGISETVVPIGDTFDPTNYYNKSEIDSTFGSGFTESSVTEVIEANEMVTSAALNDLNENKQDVLSAGTGIIINGNVISSTAIGDVDPLLDLESNNPVANSAITIAINSKANSGDVYTKSETSGTTELTTEFAKYYTKSETSGATELSIAFSHINDTFGSGFSESSVTEVIEANEMVTSAALNDLNENKAEKVHTHTANDITGLGTMAYENTSSYSSATEINTALGNKVDISDIADFFDDAKYELSGETHVINFYNGNTVKATIDATDFIKDGFLSGVTVEDRVISGETVPCLVFEWNTDSSIQETVIPIGGTFDPTNYYNKSEIDSTLGSGFSESSVTEVIEANEMVTSAALNDLSENKADTSDLNTLNGFVTSHISNSDIHVTVSDKTAWNGKLDASDVADFFDDAKYELSGQTHVINFYNGNTVKATIDATDFIKDGFLSGVTLENRTIQGETQPCLVFEWNTDAGITETVVPIGDAFDPSNYYTKSETSGSTELSTAFESIDDTFGSGFSESSVTEVIEANEMVTSAALNDLNENKLSTSTFATYSGSIETALAGKSNSSHTHASSGVTAMSGYAMALSGTPITTSDTLNEAIGKLEKMIDEIKDFIEQKELGISAALTDLDYRLQMLET